MKYQNANLSRRLIDLAVSTAFMLLLCALAAMGQDMRTRLEMRRLSEQQMRDREYALYHAGEGDKTPAAVEQQRRNAFPQIQEDFKQLQIVNNHMMSVVAASKVLDYKLVSETTSEISKRATRLKSNLGLFQVNVEGQDEHKPKDKDQTARNVLTVDAAKLKTALFQLDNLIMSFIKSPVFAHQGVISVPDSDKANHDLANIVELSRTIKKSAEKLNKDVQK